MATDSIDNYDGLELPLKKLASIPIIREEHHFAIVREKNAQIARLKEALEFYADPRAKIDPHLPGGIPDFYYELDFGERARTALAG